MSNVREQVWALALAGMSIAGCTPEADGREVIADAGETGDGETGAGDGDGDSDTGCGDAVGHRALRRLTRNEYEATVRAVFTLDAATWTGSSLIPDASVEGYNTNAAALTVDEDYAASLLASSEAVADLVTESPRFEQLLPCAVDPGAGLDCADAYLERFGRLLYRRPLAPEERERYVALIESILVDADLRAAIHTATVALLNSPHFVYRQELGQLDGDRYALDAWELATALAFTYTGAGPSEGLLDLVEVGGLDDPEAIAATVRYLVFDPVSEEVRPEVAAKFFEFGDQWLGLAKLRNMTKDPIAVPGFDGTIGAAMIDETHALMSAVLFEQRGTVGDLLTAPITVLSPELASYYGWGEVVGEQTEVVRPDDWGVGLLAQGSVLAVSSNNRATSPTQRGLLVRDRLLCFHPPAPPPGVPTIPPPTPEMTTRERYEQHASDSLCAGCHDYMDPIGFGFEHLDAGGRFQALDNGQPIDASGVLGALGSPPLDFYGQTELALALAAREEPGACLAEHVAAYSFGLAQTEVGCLVEGPAADLGAGRIGVLDYWMGLASAPHFRYRDDG